MALQLPSKLAELLSEVIWKHRPDLIGVLGSLQDVQLTEYQRDELRQVVTDEFTETGLRDDDEPNARGLLLEELIDRLGHL
jgi:hypothetical protein